MYISKNGLNMVKSFEGYKSTAYKDQRGIWTLGYGHTLGVKAGDTCTLDQAICWLLQDLTTSENVVNTSVKVPINQNQFDALVSFTYNVGQGNFINSTLLKVLNSGDILDTANQFLAWVHAGSAISTGLVKRREAERALFLQEV